MKYLFALITLITLSSCQNDNSVDYDKQNESEIKDYIEKNNLDAQKSSSGLYYVIEEQGSGSQPNANSGVTVNYKGYYTSGKVFDQNNDISFNLQQVIQGWTEGITYFKEGGNGILLIPSRLGYGYSSKNGIPGGSVLIFDIDLLEVK
ncbi:MAG: FKBP-type peptidyl-prolyl cis-trans isomerase [Flavobacteriaceae bacterium]|nr:FKBP-type peptidyl-prolyl cis-trans isomerase [Flavobacteriaceae bacterium]